MELFDVAKYQLPKDVDIEWETTKEKFSIFLSEYKNLREKVGIPPTPRIQETYSMIHRENVSPEELENELSKSRLIKEILVSEYKNIIKAEILPDYEYANNNGINDIENEIRNLVDKYNCELPTYKRIGMVIIRDTEFEKTTSKKIKREYTKV